MFSIRFMALTMSLVLGLYGCVHVAEAETRAKSENFLAGDWNIYSKNEMGRLFIKDGRYRFVPKNSLIMTPSSNPKKDFFFIEKPEGKITCDEISKRKVRCKINDHEAITATSLSPTCDWEVTHDDRAVPWFAMQCLPENNER